MKFMFAELFIWHLRWVPGSDRRHFLGDHIRIPKVIRASLAAIPISHAKVDRRADPAHTAKGALVPIRQFLAGKAVDPEIISEMSDALQSVCEALSYQN